MKCDFEKLTTEQQNLYLMVAQAYLAQFYSEYSYTLTKITITCSGEIFIGTGTTVLDLGWKIIYRNEEKADKKDGPILPEVKEKDKISFFEARTITKQTKTPSRFNPSTLLKAMKEIYKYVRDESLKREMKECCGIGTEATRAGIIEKLQKTGFLVLENKFLIPTEKAKMAVKILPEELTYPDTTAIWEKALEDIANSNVPLDDFFKKQIYNINNIISSVKEMKLTLAKGTAVCPNCNKIMIKRKGKTGFFWGCSGYPECKTIVPDKIQKGIWR